MRKYFNFVAERLPEFGQTVSNIKNKAALPVMVTGLSHINKAHFLSAIAAKVSGQAGDDLRLIAVTESENEALRLIDDINELSGEVIAAVFPARDINLGSTDAFSREYEYQRLAALANLMFGDLKLVVATAEALAQFTIPPEVLRERSIIITPDDTVDLTQIGADLVKLGYTRTDMLESPAQFSVRGAILDVFPVGAELPFRIELWDDTVDTVSVFDLQTQRRIDTVKVAVIPPAREFLFDDEQLKQRLTLLAKKVRGGEETAVKRMLSADIERIAGGASPKNPEKYAQLCYDTESLLTDYADAIIQCEHVAISESFRGAYARFEEDLTLLFESGELCRGLERHMLQPAQLKSLLAANTRAYLETFARGGDIRLSKILSVRAGQLAGWSGEYTLLADELRSRFDQGYSVAILAGTEKAARQLAQDLKDDHFAADYVTDANKLYARRAYILPGAVSSGFEYPECKIALLTLSVSPAQKSEGYTQTKSKTRKKRKPGEEIRALTDISAGDYVVHDNYGVAIFEGITKFSKDGISKDYIKLRYAGTDALYVPVTQLDLISRYVGNTDPGAIKLNKLHSDQWQKAKARAKTAADELAQDLIDLYAKRAKMRGYPFAPDGEEQHEFENHFAYIETEDQLRCIAEIKRDMQSEKPMDRLLCGDVGFGKTEVALRGAFKCVMEGKQCALLCPTTVLAWQHYQTAIKRMEQFPVNIELLSRFRSPKEIKETLVKLKKGIVDLVIGTHRLVQSDVEFKDLGLVIIDEEQRFGVSHKEKFKGMFAGVDVLTLSATPIPRTLNMAMSGVRDMSVIETPPQDRQPVSTYVIEHDWGVVSAAITKEIRRSGQVYYVHNRIETIYDCAAQIHKLVPEANIGIAHGKMDEEALLEVWRKLLDREIDVLVCTTLIETGIDVPNVNTLVIENADNMGLAQLHQLRGRVGRTNRRAFAYFSFKSGKQLSEIAEKRLNAIREFTQFGAGFRVAMRDLEIRGAGAILGERQSGHLSNVGYDMYLRLLSAAVAEKQTGKQSTLPELENECLVDVKLDAYIPEYYISNPAQRIACYKRIAAIKTEDDSFDVTDELIDRYGEMPESVRGLINVAELRGKAQKLGITEIIQTGEDLNIYLPKPDTRRLSEMAAHYGKRMNLNLVGKVCVSVKLNRGESPLEPVRRFVQ